MTVRQIQLMPGKLPGLLAKSGRSPSDGVPFRWLESLVQEIRGAIESEEEEGTCLIFGSEHLRAVYTHTLDPVEDLQERLTLAESKLQRITNALPRAGEAMTAADLEAIRFALQLGAS